MTFLQELILLATFPFQERSPPPVFLISTQSSSYFSDYMFSSQPLNVDSPYSSSLIYLLFDICWNATALQSWAPNSNPVPLSDQKYSPIYPYPKTLIAIDPFGTSNQISQALLLTSPFWPMALTSCYTQSRGHHAYVLPLCHPNESPVATILSWKLPLQIFIAFPHKWVNLALETHCLQSLFLNHPQLLTGKHPDSIIVLPDSKRCFYCLCG